MTTHKTAPNLRVVATRKTYPKTSLIEPTTSGYRLMAVQVDRRPTWLPPSSRKRSLLREAARTLATVRGLPSVHDATLFDAILTPPGRGEYLRERPDPQRPTYDVVVLVETESLEQAKALGATRAWRALEALLDSDGAATAYHLTATNVRRIGPVDHERDGVFLFNWFVADSPEQNLAVWEYTAGWFQSETGLNNSTVLWPDNQSGADYSLINHCRWDSLASLLPSLVFNRTFRSYVLANFAANRTAAVPMLYRRVRT